MSGKEPNYPNANSDDEDIEEAEFIQTYDTDEVVRYFQNMTVKDDDELGYDLGNPDDEDGDEYIFVDEYGNIVDMNGMGQDMSDYVFIDENGEVIDVGQDMDDMVVNEDDDDGDGENGQYYVYFDPRNSGGFFNPSNYFQFGTSAFDVEGITSMGSVEMSEEFQKDLKDNTLSLEDFILKYESGAEFFELYEMGNEELTDYLGKKENLEKMVNIFVGNFEGVKMEEPEIQRNALYSTVNSVFMSYRNNGLKNRILENFDILDNFFSTFYVALPSDDWWDLFYNLARRCNNSANFAPYFKQPSEQGTLGDKFIKKIIEYCDDPMCMKQITLLFNDDPTSKINWTDFDFLNLGDVISKRFEEMSTFKEFTYEHELQASSLASLCEVLLNKNSAVSTQLQQPSTINTLINIAFANEVPHIVAANVVVVLLKLFDFNQSDNIIDALEKLDKSFSNLHHQIVNPTLQHSQNMLGLYRQHLVQFITNILQYSNEKLNIIHEIFQNGLLDACLDKLFIHKRNNVVHQIVLDIVKILLSKKGILSNTIEAFEKYKLLDKLIASLNDTENTYAPYVATISRLLNDIKNEESAKKLFDRNDWNNFMEERVTPLLDSYHPLTDTSSLPMRMNPAMFSFIS